MNTYRVTIKLCGGFTTINTPPLRNESEAKGWAIAWWNTKFGRHPEDFIYPIIEKVSLLKRGIVPHDLSSGTCES